MASTTSFDRKGLRFGMESSPASVEVKGSMQAEGEKKRRETGEKKKKNDRETRVERRGRGGDQSQTTATREG